MTSGFGSGNQVHEVSLLTKVRLAVIQISRWFISMFGLLLCGYFATLIFYLFVTGLLVLRAEMIRQSQPSAAISIVFEETVPEVWRENLQVTIGPIFKHLPEGNPNRLLRVNEVVRQTDILVVHIIANPLVYIVIGLLASRFDRIYSAFLIPVLLMPVTNQLVLSDMYWSGKASSDFLFLGIVVGQLLCLYIFCLVGRVIWD